MIKSPLTKTDINGDIDRIENIGVQIYIKYEIMENRLCHKNAQQIFALYSRRCLVPAPKSNEYLCTG